MHNDLLALAADSTPVTVEEVVGTELYHRYPRETSSQPCYVELDPARRILSASYSGEIGNARPAAVYHERVLRWRIPALRAKAANALLTTLAELAPVVCDGFEVVWDGSNQVGHYSTAARQAIEAIAAHCELERESDDVVAVWDADNWFAGMGSHDTQRRELGITAATTDDELANVAARARADARAEEVDVLEGLDRYLAALRAEAVADAAEEGDDAPSSRQYVVVDEVAYPIDDLDEIEAAEAAMRAAGVTTTPVLVGNVDGPDSYLSGATLRV